MLLLSSLAQAASVIGSSRIAARFADIPKFNPCSRSDAARSRPSADEREFAFRFCDISILRPRGCSQQRRTGPPSLGKQWRQAGLISTVAAGGDVVRPRPRISLAALGSGRNVLDGGLRDLVGLERGHLLMGAMMAVLATHLGIGVQRVRLRLLGVLDARLHLCGFGSRSLRCLVGAGCHYGSGKNGNGEQCCGNGLQHGCLLIQRGSRGCRSESPGSSIMLATLRAAR